MSIVVLHVRQDWNLFQHVCNVFSFSLSPKNPTQILPLLSFAAIMACTMFLWKNKTKHTNLQLQLSSATDTGAGLNSQWLLWLIYTLILSIDHNVFMAHGFTVIIFRFSLSKQYQDNLNTIWQRRWGEMPGTPKLVFRPFTLCTLPLVPAAVLTQCSRWIDSSLNRYVF